MINKIRFVLLIVTLVIMVNPLSAKKQGKYASYSQVTDKEVLVVSNKGVKVLFKAYDNDHVGFSWHQQNETVNLILPSAVIKTTGLKGSIYVEELDELMQITTTSRDGLLIKVDKKNFAFTFINKTNNKEIVIDEGILSGIVSVNVPAMVVEHLEEKTNISTRTEL